MQGIVTLLDPEHYAATEAVWAELAEALGIRGVYVTPFPHFSYHVAAAYDRGRLGEALARLAAETRPFVVTTAGLGAFTGPAPVLYLSVVRTAALSAFHAALWAGVTPVAMGSQGYYAPSDWMPHITLAAHDLTPATLAEAMRRLGGRNFNWEIPVDHIAYIDDGGGRQAVAARVALGGPNLIP